MGGQNYSTTTKQYTKSRRQSPVYWQLKTPSGDFSIWLYYNSISQQSLISSVLDHIEPKIELVRSDISNIKSSLNRSKQEEDTLDMLSLKLEELNVFKDEVLRLTKFWQPDLNDGVMITAAPLWRLFQHKAWQKKLKQTWEKLEEGEYDWAHLAFSTWPERVLKKSHGDRSLAIAHDVETDLWHEVEVIKGKKKEPVWEWQPKLLSDAELHAYIKERIATDKRLKLYRSNQSANANGGAL